MNERSSCRRNRLLRLLAVATAAGTMCHCAARISAPTGGPGGTIPVPNNPNNPSDPVNPNMKPPPPPKLPPNDPNAIPLLVRDTAGIARTADVLRSGIPVPRDNNWLATNDLSVRDPDGAFVPATFKVLARWNAGKGDTTAPIQWMLVSFPADLQAGQSKYYEVVRGQAAAAPATPLTLSRTGDQITVNTGAASFVLGADAGALFDAISLADGTQLLNGGSSLARVGGTNHAHTGLRGVRVEHQDALSAVVVVEGTYAMPNRGGGALSSRKRYVFHAGSPTAVVRHSVAWEGDSCGGGGAIECGSVNGVLIERLRSVLNVNFSGTAIMASGSVDEPLLQGTMGEASVRQLLRNERTDDLAFEVTVPGTGGARGTKATGGMLALTGAQGGIGIALARMHRYEPQALRVLADGSLAIDIADDRMWLGARQGMFARFAVTALSPSPSRSDLDQNLWAPLNRPLRAWPTPEHFVASQAVDEIPLGELSGPLAGYDDLVRSSLVRTLENVEDKGLGGVMTFGLYPRYWASAQYGDELGCSDPTPGQSWDELYWCATWTDYHNTVATAPIWAIRSGETEWLDEVGTPGALRMLHTQVQQCGPGDDDFYCGQAPGGYGGYRADFNGSHAYFDNLFLYYWLSGDETVIETLTVGAKGMRNFFCPQRGEAGTGAVCANDQERTDEWARFTGRAGAQWVAVFRFLGLAGDASFLDDWRSTLARGVTQFYVQAVQDGESYGFWLGNSEAANGPGSDYTDQLWMASLYDMNNLYRWQIETQDAQLGTPPIRASEIQSSWARTLVTYGSGLAGNRTADGVWPNNLVFDWTGNRLGGQLQSVAADVDPDGNGSPCDSGDECLWETGKAAMTAVIVRGGQFTTESTMLELGSGLTERAISLAASEELSLGKIHGLYLSRLHAAVARLKP